MNPNAFGIWTAAQSTWLDVTNLLVEKGRYTKDERFQYQLRKRRGISHTLKTTEGPEKNKTDQRRTDWIVDVGQMMACQHYVIGPNNNTSTSRNAITRSSCFHFSLSASSFSVSLFLICSEIGVLVVDTFRRFFGAFTTVLYPGLLFSIHPSTSVHLMNTYS